MDEKLIEMMLTAGKVRVTYGVHDVRMKVAGLTVGQVKIAYADILNFAPDAPAYLGGRMVDDSVVLKAGDHIEYMKAAGEKGAFAQPIAISFGSSYLTEDFFGSGNGSGKEWGD
jgi:hypothetical protein